MVQADGDTGTTRVDVLHPEDWAMSEIWDEKSNVQIPAGLNEDRPQTHPWTGCPRLSSKQRHTHMDTTSALPSLYCLMNGWSWKTKQGLNHCIKINPSLEFSAIYWSSYRLYCSHMRRTKVKHEIIICFFFLNVNYTSLLLKGLKESSLGCWFKSRPRLWCVRHLFHSSSFFCSPACSGLLLLRWQRPRLQHVK